MNDPLALLKYQTELFFGTFQNEDCKPRKTHFLDFFIVNDCTLKSKMAAIKFLLWVGTTSTLRKI